VGQPHCRCGCVPDPQIRASDGERRQRAGGRSTCPGGGADGGVDLVLSRNGAKSLVQCKQWRQQSVGVQVVREQFGILTAEGAAEAIIVISGAFTLEACDFARGKPIRLIDGPELLRLIRSLQDVVPAGVAPVKAANDIGGLVDDAPACPECGQQMVLRTSRRGANAGSRFWGCSAFPRCRGIRPA
jgi:restriction system protein